MLSWSTSKVGARRSSSLTIGARAPAPPLPVPTGAAGANDADADAEKRLQGTRSDEAGLLAEAARPATAQPRAQLRASIPLRLVSDRGSPAPVATGSASRSCFQGPWRELSTLRVCGDSGSKALVGTGEGPGERLRGHGHGACLHRGFAGPPSITDNHHPPSATSCIVGVQVEQPRRRPACRPLRGHFEICAGSGSGYASPHRRARQRPPHADRLERRITFGRCWYVPFPPPSRSPSPQTLLFRSHPWPIAHAPCISISVRQNQQQQLKNPSSQHPTPSTLTPRS